MKAKYMDKKKKFDVKLEIKGIEAVCRDVLDTFDFEYPGKRTELLINTDEFTCLCPWSGLPDFANLTICYVPERKCIELKSLKYYLLSYRNVGIVHEHAVNRILDDLVRVSDPIEMHVEMEFNLRGGIKTTVKASYVKEES
ncbi:MAG: preQ(1) synthase [Candidatus Hydrothermarchaeales archaeon]